jgi:hypothetical protein
VHDQLSADVAKKLGARSLREALLSTQCSMASQPCPNPQTLFTSLSPYIQVWTLGLRDAGSCRDSLSSLGFGGGKLILDNLNPTDAPTDHLS